MRIGGFVGGLLRFLGCGFLVSGRFYWSLRAVLRLIIRHSLTNARSLTVAVTLRISRKLKGLSVPRRLHVSRCGIVAQGLSDPNVGYCSKS